jgi:hypothetical protein
MRLAALGLCVAVALGSLDARAQQVGDAAPGCSDPTLCPQYVRFGNHKYGFAVDLPTFFEKKAGDADGRGQPFEYGKHARIRAWAMYDNPPMTINQLYGDWTRRDGITFKTLAGNSWVVRGKEHGQMYYSRSILSDGIICTVEVSFDPDLAEAFEPILARIGPTLAVVPGEGLRGKTH